MHRSVTWILILLGVASTSIVSARAATVPPAVSRSASVVIGAQSKDCRPINGPYGYYGNIWCDGNKSSGKKSGATTRQREKRKPSYAKKPRPSKTRKVETTERKQESERPVKGAVSETPPEKAVVTENSSIARVSSETEKTSGQTALEGDTQPTAEPTKAALCKRYVPTVETVSAPCPNGDSNSANCKQYRPTVKTVSVPCE